MEVSCSTSFSSELKVLNDGTSGPRSPTLPSSFFENPYRNHWKSAGLLVVIVVSMYRIIILTSITTTKQKCWFVDGYSGFEDIVYLLILTVDRFR